MADPSPFYTGLDGPRRETVRRAARARLLAYEAGQEGERGQSDRSEARFEEAFALHPADPLVRLRRATLLQSKATWQLQNRDVEGGFATYRRLLAGIPLNAESVFQGLVHTGIASAFNMMDQPEDALAELDMAAQYVPRFNQMWLLRGLVLFRLQRLGESLDALDTAEERGNRDLELYLARAVIQAQMGRGPEAREALRRAETLYPGDPRIAMVRQQVGG
jgi:tetratricopeptide (TPR) repeat protein